MGFSLQFLSIALSALEERLALVKIRLVSWILPGNGTLDKPYILIGAHLDHIGKGTHSSRAKG